MDIPSTEKCVENLSNGKVGFEIYAPGVWDAGFCTHDMSQLSMSWPGV